MHGKFNACKEVVEYFKNAKKNLQNINMTSGNI